ncbi:MAG: hypothetical protein U9P81_00490 [Euryarchaeota archaeon]|nr:hypothetical protein [Euryarchaeota archaeon]
MKGLQNKSRIISVIITMLVILMLIISEPAGAVTVKVDTTNMPTTVGQEGYFFFNVTIGGNEKIPIANFTIEGLPRISGSDDGNLSFTVSEIGIEEGNSLPKGNYDIKLVKMDGYTRDDRSSKGYSYNYGYKPPEGRKPFEGYGGFGYVFTGYGYGYGITSDLNDEYTQFAYKITIDTTGATAETYDEVKGIIYTGDSDKESFSTTSTSSFTLKAEESKKSSSSGSSGGSSKYSWVSSTHTPTSTESKDTTSGQPTPTKTVGEVSTDDVQETQTPTPTETEDGGLPGFTAIMFIAGLLAATYIIIRKRG